MNNTPYFITNLKSFPQVKKIIHIVYKSFPQSVNILKKAVIAVFFEKYFMNKSVILKNEMHSLILNCV